MNKIFRIEIIDKSFVESGKIAIKNSMGEVSKLELLAFPAGLLILKTIGKTPWLARLFPNFCLDNSGFVDFPKAMKAYGLSCSILAAVMGGFLLLLTENRGIEPFLLYFGGVFGCFFIPGSKLKKNMIKRERMIKRIFPRIIDQTIILLEAGYSTAMIWRHMSKILPDTNPIDAEIKKLANSFTFGMGEEEFYKEMTRSLNSVIVLRFCNLCLQSLKKGSVDLISGLREISSESWQNRKWDAVKMGEEASGKMILPLMLVFVGVLIIVMVPAILQLGTI